MPMPYHSFGSFNLCWQLLFREAYFETDLPWGLEDDTKPAGTPSMPVEGRPS